MIKVKNWETVAKSPIHRNWFNDKSNKAIRFEIIKGSSCKIEFGARSKNPFYKDTVFVKQKKFKTKYFESRLEALEYAKDFMKRFPDGW